MNINYNKIVFYYYLIDGEKVEGTSDNFESMVLNFRKKLKANKVNRAESGTLRYRFPHESDFKSA